MKKTYELCVLTGAEALILVDNETGHVYSYATSKFKPILENQKNIIKSCLYATGFPTKPNDNEYKYDNDDEE
ncbi:SRFA [Hepatospora eriocheir]|uniref:SRFA n=1 Tax=Hepatospora eriocheir TaxID=1081669 RepID=A0A1X0QF16_9MICR|nr:SRFA [Hepatospora eriocheir]